MSHNSLKWSVVIDWASLVASVVKNLPVKAGNISSIPGSERSPGERNGYSLQYSCLGNPMDRGAWRATIHSFIQWLFTEPILCARHCSRHQGAQGQSKQIKPPATFMPCSSGVRLGYVTDVNHKHEQSPFPERTVLGRE